MYSLLGKLKIILSLLLNYKVIILCLAAVLFVPASKMDFFWLDDGVSMANAVNVLDSLKNFNLSQFAGVVTEESLGRFRPVYWLWQAWTFWVAGNNPALHYFLHFLLFVGVCFFIYKIVYSVSLSKAVSLFAAAIFLINPLSGENLYRLGPQEPIMSFFLTAFIYFGLVKKLDIPALFFLMLFFLSKEISVAIFPPILVFYLGKRLFLRERDFSSEKYTLVSFLFSLAIMLAIRQFGTVHSVVDAASLSEYPSRLIGFLKIISNSFEVVFPFFVVSFFVRSTYLCCKNGIKWVDEIFLLELFMGVAFASFLLIQALWGFVLPRYAMFLTVPLVMFMGLELQQLCLLLKRERLIYRGCMFAFITFVILFVTVGLVNNFYLGRRYVYYTYHVQSLMRYLAENSPRDSKILLNFKKGDATLEYVLETSLHLQLLYNRKDLQVDYLDLNRLPSVGFVMVSGSFVPTGYNESLIRGVAYGRVHDLQSTEEVVVVTTPLNLIKQISKKSFRTILFREPFSTAGIYSRTYLKDNWRIVWFNSGIGFAQSRGFTL